MLDNDPEEIPLGDSFVVWFASSYGQRDHDFSNDYSDCEDHPFSNAPESHLLNPMDRVVSGPRLAPMCHWCQQHPIAADHRLMLHPDFGMLCLSCRAALAAFIDRLAEHRGWRHARAADALFGLLDLTHSRI